MKLRSLPKTLSDCIAVIIDLSNEIEELKSRMDRKDNAAREGIRQYLELAEGIENKIQSFKK